MHSAVRIGLIGDFNPQHKAHDAIPSALAAAHAGAEGVWVSTDSVGSAESLAEFNGLWCVPGMPYRRAAGAMRAIQYARMTRTPFLGASAGFQYAVIEYARHVLGFSEAGHQKIDPECAMPLITVLDAALAGVRARVRITAGSRLCRAHGGAQEAVVEYHCSYGLNGRYRRMIEGGELTVAAVDDQNEVRAVELDNHPFFIATLFQPELATPSPLVIAFVSACERRRIAAMKAAS